MNISFATPKADQEMLTWIEDHPESLAYKAIRIAEKYGGTPLSIAHDMVVFAHWLGLEEGQRVLFARWAARRLEAK